MKIRGLIKRLQEYEKQFWDIKVEIDWWYDDCWRYLDNKNINWVCLENNSYDKRLKQRTIIVIN